MFFCWFCCNTNPKWNKSWMFSFTDLVSWLDPCEFTPAICPSQISPTLTGWTNWLCGGMLRPGVSSKWPLHLENHKWSVAPRGVVPTISVLVLSWQVRVLHITLWPTVKGPGVGWWLLGLCVFVAQQTKPTSSTASINSEDKIASLFLRLSCKTVISHV